MASKLINIRWIKTGSHQYWKIIELTPVWLAQAFRPLGLIKMVPILNFFFDIRGKLSIIQ